MNPNIAANQQRLFLAFLAELRPHVRRDSSLPRRIKEIFARHRALGSRDRKLYRELVYTYLRFLPWIDGLLDADAALAAKITAWLAPESKPTSSYRAAHCGDWPAVPDSLAAKSAFLISRFFCPAAAGTNTGLAAASNGAAFSFSPAALLPEWFRSHCPAVFASPHLDALNSRANVWVRIQCNDRNLVLDEFRARNWAFTIPADFPDAVCLPPNAEVATSDAYRRGFVEIQDLGSQMLLAHAPLPLTGRWLDACAGAGGKTLQLARLLGSSGHVDAADIRPEILEELRDRAQRARLDNVRITNIHPMSAAQSPTGNVRNTNIGAAVYDGVLVDAPCSGSGTWRRQPHLKWYVQPETIAAFAKTQLEILTVNAPRVKPGGLLIYATCSLSHHENHDVVAAFLAAHSHFKAEPPAKNHGGTFDGLGTTLLPGTHNTDGFYVALLRKS
ncbi:MAG: RsmB/NOP family class I SAM-dependent RNA methyltransferase [Opitutae bacterium]|nr:RsmB/NOP family class I SAM-dependent RNA methyltransferase [Opitutae bacterium]